AALRTKRLTNTTPADRICAAIALCTPVSRCRLMRPVREDRYRRPLALSAARDLFSRVRAERNAHARTPHDCTVDSLSRRSRDCRAPTWARARDRDTGR